MNVSLKAEMRSGDALLDSAGLTRKYCAGAWKRVCKGTLGCDSPL